MIESSESSTDDACLAITLLSRLSPEADLMLATARPSLSLRQREDIYLFLAKHGKELDWGWFVDQACRHGVLPLIGRNLMRYRLTHSDEGRALAPYRWLYQYAYEGNRRRNLAVGDEFAKVIQVLNDKAIDHAIRKGPVLIEGIYQDIGVRRMGDLDVLLRRNEFPAFAAALGESGYKQGHQSRSGQQVIPFDRKTQVFWRMNLNHVALPFIKLAYRDDVDLFVVDPCLSLFQQSSGIVADSADFLDRAVAICVYGQNTKALDAVDQIIDVCVQIHVEATSAYYIENGKDLTILKFLDLALLMANGSEGAHSNLKTRAEAYGCLPSVYYALHHARQLYPDMVAAEQVVTIQPANEDLLNEYGAFDGEVLRWEHPFVERLFDSKRVHATAIRSVVPGPRAVV